MKKLITFCTILILSTSTFAQSPEMMSYQAVVRDGSNNLVISTAVGMKLSILQGSANGTAVYVETQTPTSNANGLVSMEIGNGTVISGNFTTIDWANGPYFLKSETDPTGGTSYTITGTSQLLSVPYALYAKSAGSVTNGSNFTHYIGEEFGGGIIFHLWRDPQGVEHGLIVDKTDLSTSQIWSNLSDDALVGPQAQSNWDGLSNSNAIVSQPGHTISAAALCLNSTNGGQSDWYLPSLQELHTLMNNYYNVSRSLSQISGATQLQPFAYYLSSTEADPNYAWCFVFQGIGDIMYKGNESAVRAVRSF